MKHFCAFLFSFILCISSAFGQDQDSPVSVKLLLEGGLEYGGDEILQVFFTNGGDQVMRAGQGGYLAVGGQLESDNVKSLMLRASLGIKYNTTAADNANIRLTRFPINVVGYWKINDDFRLGAGFTSHQSVRFKGDGFVDDVDFTSSVGPRFEFGYKWAALTYTSVEYTTGNASVSASSFGFSMSFTLPNK